MRAPLHGLTPLVAVLLAGCASGPTSEPPPAWVEQGTHTDDDGLQAVGEAPAEAEDYRKQARRDAVEQIALAAGVDVATVDRQRTRTTTDEAGVAARSPSGEREALRRGGFEAPITLAGDAFYTRAGKKRYAVRMRVDRDALAELRERKAEDREARRQREQAHLANVEPVREPAFESVAGGRVDWYRGVVEVTGTGTADADQPEAVAEQAARRAARAMAYARLQEVREGVAVARSQTVEQGRETADTVRLAHAGRVQARVVKQAVEREGEQVVARATVRDRLPTSDVPEGAVILDAGGTEFRPALHTRVETMDGTVLADPHGSDPGTPYARTVAEAVTLGADPAAQVPVERAPLPGVVAVEGLTEGQRRAIERGDYVVVQ